MKEAIMLKIQSSEELQTVANDFIYSTDDTVYHLSNICDSSCMNVEDEDMSSYDIFTSGFQLAIAAAAKESEIWEVNHLPGQITFFFIGTEEEIIAKIEALSDKYRVTAR